ncbi:hypothetical protein ACT3HK_10775 [Thermolongibacillus altinsuensis]
MSIKLPIKHNVEVECKKCSNMVYSQLLIQDIEYANSDEREMGTEIQYDFRVDIQCPNCSSTLEVRGEVWEYPEGVVNHIQIV